MYIETPRISVVQIPDERAVAIARQVMRLLATEAWVQVHGTACERSAQWTVLDRAKDGMPANIAYTDHYGNVGTLSLGTSQETDNA